MKKVFILISIFFIILLVVYLVVEFAVNQPDMEVMAYTETVNTGDGIKQLVADVEAGNTTGIDSWDSSQVQEGDTRVLTPGSGDFAKIKAGTYMHVLSGEKINTNWSTSASSKVGSFLTTHKDDFYQNCVYYDNIQMPVLKDRYIPVAMGTYWFNTFNLDHHAGQLYRVNLKNGNHYDVVALDVKANDHCNYSSDNPNLCGSSTIEDKFPGNSKCKLAGVGQPKSSGITVIELMRFYDSTGAYSSSSVQFQSHSKEPHPLDGYFKDSSGNWSEVGTNVAGYKNRCPFFDSDIESITHLEDPETQDWLDSLV